MADLSQKLNDIEVALQKVFEQRDWDEFLELDTALQDILAGYKAIDETPPRDQIERIQNHYQTMRSWCMKRRLHLSKKMESMRQQRGALNAYALCFQAGSSQTENRAGK
ncbi:flagellar protein FliT [Sansalvadorimonas sp. 2012CJ34-2]|uniref:Flagellar protein FliT n=1 Tax=Parendozoicomonas callyspongiae TaxID=2942213 RepID=A0ABT0PGD1_9GAMM|nr:flagellar protein FliT [Sansalvadorimonas sp. 2012CJ34-2]MCL6270086.1 flagellar protein FliT [Sansalvadorimonas sp. 2012CJ34-2]